MKKKKHSDKTLRVMGSYQKEGKTYTLIGNGMTSSQLERYLFWMDVKNFFRRLLGLKELPYTKLVGNAKKEDDNGQKDNK